MEKKMTKVAQALKRITTLEQSPAIEDDCDSDYSDLADSNGRSQNRPLPSPECNELEGVFFCVEDTFSVNNVQVVVDGVGPLSFPIEEPMVKNIVQFSKKAMFGKGDKTLLDTNVRDTQVIPAKKLSVKIDQQSLLEVLSRVSQEMNLEAACTLVPHLYNMLVYGPGQFFKMHQDTEKVPNMIATMIIVLPSAHKGGDLIIRHNTERHRFFGSTHPNMIKCIVFYSDCFHEVLKVVEGYRVALTYNIELQSPPISEGVPINKTLKDAVENYFKGVKKRNKLIYLLDHQYSERNLRWYLMKGFDRSRAYSLYALAKQKGYSPCLALADYCKSTEGPNDDPVTSDECQTNLCFWVDEKEFTFKFETDASDDEICYTTKTESLFQHYKEAVGDGYQGNWAAPNDYWYKRACIVIWRSPWAYPHGYAMKLSSFHQLTTKPGMERILADRISKNSKNFFLTKQWLTPRIGKMLLDISIYLGSGELSLKILSNLSPILVLNLENKEMVSWILSSIDVDTWKILIDSWKALYKENLAILVRSILPFLVNCISEANILSQVSNYLFDVVTGLLSKDYNNRIELSAAGFIETFRELMPLCLKLRGEGEDFKLMDQILESSIRGSIKTVKDLNNLRLALSPEHFAHIQQSNLTRKILSDLSPKEVLELKCSVEMSWITNCLNSKIWKEMMSQWSWKWSRKSNPLFKTILKIINKCISDENGLPICLALLDEAVKIVTKSMNSYYQSNSADDFIKNFAKIIPVCKKLNRVDTIDHIASTSFEKFIITVPDFKKLQLAISTEIFDRLGLPLWDKIIDRILSSILRQKPSEVSESNIKDIVLLLQTSSDFADKSHESRIIDHLISNPSLYTAEVLGKLFSQLLDVTESDKIQRYVKLKNHTLKCINDEMEKLGNTSDWSVSFKVRCTSQCSHCKQVNQFLASRTQSSITILAPEKKRNHICKLLGGLGKIPIKHETILGSPYELVVTKLPEVGNAKLNHREQLLPYRKKIEDAFAVAKAKTLPDTITFTHYLEHSYCQNPLSSVPEVKVEVEIIADVPPAKVMKRSP